MLDVASIWAEDNRMKWNTKVGKSEVLESSETVSRQFLLSGKPLSKVKEATYLGVALSDSGVTDTKMLDRIRKAKIAVHQLKPLGLSPKGISAKKAIRLYCERAPRSTIR